MLDRLRCMDMPKLLTCRGQLWGALLGEREAGHSKRQRSVQKFDRSSRHQWALPKTIPADQTRSSARGCAGLQCLLLDSHNFAQSSDCRDTHLSVADLRYWYVRTTELMSDILATRLHI